RRHRSGLLWRLTSCPGAGSLGNADPFDFPLEFDAACLIYAAAHLLAEIFDVGGARIAAIDQEIAMHLRHLRVADDKPAAAGAIDKLPGLMAGRILEGRAAGFFADRLRRLARRGDALHLGEDGGGRTSAALEQRLRKDHLLGRIRMAIAVAHLRVGERVEIALAVDPACFGEDVLGLAPMRASIHAQRAADRAGNAAIKSETVDAGLRR